MEGLKKHRGGLQKIELQDVGLLTFLENVSNSLRISILFQERK